MKLQDLMNQEREAARAANPRRASQYSPIWIHLICEE